MAAVRYLLALLLVAESEAAQVERSLRVCNFSLTLH
jgi:hypothetical protein